MRVSHHQGSPTMRRKFILRDSETISWQYAGKRRWRYVGFGLFDFFENLAGTYRKHDAPKRFEVTVSTVPAKGFQNIKIENAGERLDYRIYNFRPRKGAYGKGLYSAHLCIAETDKVLELLGMKKIIEQQQLWLKAKPIWK